MIVVVGQPVLREAEDGMTPDGAAARIAGAAAGAGRFVQLVGTAGEDEAGNQVVLALARAKVGHVALLRKAGQRTPKLRAAEPTESLEAEGDAPSATELPMSLDAGDVDLALRYLPDIDVLVLAEAASPETVNVVAQAARWADARLILVVDAESQAPDGLPDDAIVFEAPPEDPDGVFAQMVGAFAAALDDGEDPGDAFRTTVANEGWAPAEASS